jgi:hypothetical protein
MKNKAKLPITDRIIDLLDGMSIEEAKMRLRSYLEIRSY